MVCLCWMSPAVLYWIVSPFLTRLFESKYHPNNQQTHPYHCSRPLFIQGHGSGNLSTVSEVDKSFSTSISTPQATLPVWVSWRVLSKQSCLAWHQRRWSWPEIWRSPACRPGREEHAALCTPPSWRRSPSGLGSWLCCPSVGRCPETHPDIWNNHYIIRGKNGNYQFKVQHPWTSIISSKELHLCGLTYIYRERDWNKYDRTHFKIKRTTIINIKDRYQATFP